MDDILVLGLEVDDVSRVDDGRNDGFADDDSRAIDDGATNDDTEPLDDGLVLNWILDVGMNDDS